MIVAVKDGAVAEIGTHDELMEKDGVYKQLVLLQVCSLRSACTKCLPC